MKILTQFIRWMKQISDLSNNIDESYKSLNDTECFLSECSIHCDKEGGAMKQYINWNQLCELDFEQVHRLQKLINQKYHLIENEKHWNDIKNYSQTINGEEIKIHTTYLGLTEKTTIGKMIEILVDGGYLPTITDMENNCSVKISVTNTKYYREGVEFESLQVCDALWESVKYVLKC